MGLRGFLSELRRRGIYQTGAVYAAIAWVLLEVLSVIFQNFGAPTWVFKVIITDLSKLTELRVIARNSSFTYKGKSVDLKRVGRELGAHYVLEGSVRRVGDRVRVTSQLSDAADGMQVWAERYDRDLTDIFMVQDELTLEIIRALLIRLSPEVLFLMSMALQWSRRLDDSLEFAPRCLQVAPNCAMGWLQLANLLHYLDDAEESLRALDRYFELDPLYPNVALYFRAEAESALGRYQDSVVTLRQRLARNPRSQTSYALLASCYGHLGRMEDASAAWSEVLRKAGLQV
jgi:tetratricopeptide (TPR) repeat protein